MIEDKAAVLKERGVQTPVLNSCEMGSDNLVHMAEQKRFIVVELPDLRWPTSLQLRSRRFRLFIAADSRGTSVDAISEFVIAALRQGAVYCCAWGPGCERFHDIIDEVAVEDSLRERRLVAPSRVTSS